MTNEYAAAIEAHNAALVVFAAARAKFFAIPGSASKADFAEFAAAQAALKAATAEFDIAYEIEASRPEIEDEVDEIEVVGEQLDMFA